MGAVHAGKWAFGTSLGVEGRGGKRKEEGGKRGRCGGLGFPLFSCLLPLLALFSCASDHLLTVAARILSRNDAFAAQPNLALEWRTVCAVAGDGAGLVLLWRGVGASTQTQQGRAVRIRRVPSACGGAGRSGPREQTLCVGCPCAVGDAGCGVHARAAEGSIVPRVRFARVACSNRAGSRGIIPTGSTSDIRVITTTRACLI